ncbi:unnamed protein product [Arabis nemorensis]|uniref:Uncharacterized protein n=1 Tax=Arabis nemorensis TaxID=586526 RepID=A0A565CBQ7_9BRAS|nr:unnamed protein product [Arabis nemorensis]
MSVSLEDEPQLVEEPTPTKSKRPAPTGKGGKTNKVKSSAVLKAEWTKWTIVHRLRTRTQGKDAASVSAAEGSGESDSGVSSAGTSKTSKKKHEKPEMSHLSEDTKAPTPPLLLRYEANRKVVLVRDRKYPEFKKSSTSAAPRFLQLDSKSSSMFGMPTEPRLPEIVHDFNLLMKMAKSIQSRITGSSASCI